MSPAYGTVLLTGASSGIGREMALWWARRGARVWAAARREKQLEALAAEGQGKITPISMDVAREAETAERIRALDEEVGGLDLVVANAGVGDPTPGRKATWEHVERVLRINVTGAAATLTAVLPRMVERGRGHVVGVSSVAGYRGLGAYSAYCSSKAFLSVFLESLQVDLRGTGVRVTCIEPGFVKSEMTARIEGRAPMPFMATTEDAADRYCRAILRFAYPRVHAIPARLMRLVPAPIYEPLAQRASAPQVALFDEEQAARRRLV